MDHAEMDKLEWEIQRLEKMATILAESLNEKIDECEELKTRYESVNGQFRDELAENKVLKSEVARLNNLILSIDV